MCNRGGRVNRPPPLRHDQEDDITTPDDSWPVLSIRQPYAWAVMAGAKDIENRDFVTGRRGRIWVHAPKTIEPVDLSRSFGLQDVPAGGQLPVGVIIGSVEITAVVRDHRSPWAVPGKCHWLLADPRPLDVPVPCRGMPGLFKAPEEVYAALTTAA